MQCNVLSIELSKLHFRSYLVISDIWWTQIQCPQLGHLALTMEQEEFKKINDNKEIFKVPVQPADPTEPGANDFF